MEKGRLILKRASSGEWSDDNFDVLAAGIVVGRIMRAIIAPVESPWFWTLCGRKRTPDGWNLGLTPPPAGGPEAWISIRRRISFTALCDTTLIIW